MLNNAERKEILKKIGDVHGEIVAMIEENQFEPSERGAGFATKDHALVDTHQLLINSIEGLGFEPGDLTTILSASDIIKEISCHQDGSIADDFDELEHVDDFIRDNGEEKYRYVNHVYSHIPTGAFICVEEQRSSSGRDGVTLSVTAAETVKKEIVTYKWS